MIQVLSIDGRSLSDGTIQVLDAQGNIKRPLTALSDDNYVHDQAVPASTWTINHNLGYYPSVSVVDSTNRVVFGDVVYLTDDVVQVNFNGSFSGKAYIS